MRHKGANAQEFQTDMPLTSLRRGGKSGAAWLASQPPEVIEGFLASLAPYAAAALPYLFEFWAMDHQMAPDGDWKTWVILGGRGAGKTRAGAEWVRSQVEGATPLDAGRPWWARPSSRCVR